MELLLLAAALAMDASAVAAATALSHPKARWDQGLRMAFVFGVFQALMPCLGWFAGERLAGVAERYTPWIAFVILVVLGVRMIRAAVKKKEDEADGTDRPSPFAARQLLALGVATSLDALAVGVTLPLLRISLTMCAMTIGGVTFLLAAIAFQLGRFIGDRVSSRFEVAGGIALIGVGLKLLLPHLFG